MEFDTLFMDEIICPFCGTVVESNEYDESDHVGTCCECGKEFDLVVEYSVSFTTSKPDWLRRWKAYNLDLVRRKEMYEWIEEHGDD